MGDSPLILPLEPVYTHPFQDRAEPKCQWGLGIGEAIWGIVEAEDIPCQPCFSSMIPRVVSSDNLSNSCCQSVSPHFLSVEFSGGYVPCWLMEWHCCLRAKRMSPNF